MRCDIRQKITKTSLKKEKRVCSTDTPGRQASLYTYRNRRDGCCGAGTDEEINVTEQSPKTDPPTHRQPILYKDTESVKKKDYIYIKF